MTYLNSKYSPKNSQEGVTLMLAVLVLAAVTAVAFSLATIVFIEIRSAGDAARTEPALYASLGVTEEALFQYKRSVSSAVMDVPTCFPENQGICLLNGVTLSMPPVGSQPIAFDNSPREEFIAAGVTKIFPMYKVNEFVLQQYDYLKVEVLSNAGTQGVNVSSNLYKIDQINPTNPWGGTATPSVPFETTTFTPPGQYELVLRNPSSTQDVTVSITTRRVGNAEPAGLPFIGEQVLRIMANYVGLTRTYQVRIPIP